MLKEGYLVPIKIVKAFPGYDAYLVHIVGTELLAFLPRSHTSQTYRVGDGTVAVVLQVTPTRIVLSQRTVHYVRRLMELLCAPLLQAQKIRIRRVANAARFGFWKVAVESLNGEDPRELCRPYLQRSTLQCYTGDRIYIIRYTPIFRNYVVQALAPAPLSQVQRVIAFEEAREAQVFVQADTLKRFLGRQGSNVATASRLVNAQITLEVA